MYNLKYEDIMVQECENLSKREIACRCDADKKEVYFIEEVK